MKVLESVVMRTAGWGHGVMVTLEVPANSSQGDPTSSRTSLRRTGAEWDVCLGSAWDTQPCSVTSVQGRDTTPLMTVSHLAVCGHTKAMTISEPLPGFQLQNSTPCSQLWFKFRP